MLTLCLKHYTVLGRHLMVSGSEAGGYRVSPIYLLGLISHAKCEVSGMKFSSSHCENVVRKKCVDCPIHVRGRLLPQEKVWDLIHGWEIER